MGISEGIQRCQTPCNAVKTSACYAIAQILEGQYPLDTIKPSCAYRHNPLSPDSNQIALNPDQDVQALYLPFLLPQQALYPLIHRARASFLSHIVDRTLDQVLCGVRSRLRIDTGALEQRRGLVNG